MNVYTERMVLISLKKNPETLHSSILSEFKAMFNRWDAGRKVCISR